jgi:hypothetical protein
MTLSIIKGTPDMKAFINDVVHGDIATAAITVYAAKSVIAAEPGLLTMKDLSMVVCNNSS